MNDKGRCKCPICLNVGGGSCRIFCEESFVSWYECKICGTYKLTRDVFLQIDPPDQATSNGNLAPVQRAILSHRIRMKSEGIRTETSDPYTVTSDTLKWLRSSGSLPSAAVQAANIIRFVGDSVSRSGEAVRKLPGGFHAIIGAFNLKAAIWLMKELVERRKLTADPLGTAVGTDPDTGHPLPSFTNITLSLDGWEQYESEKRGTFSGNYGFIAMQFKDRDLDSFVKDVVKPAVEKIGYSLVDMKEVSRAGIIDNIMRTQIRDAAFVIADLTHDNSGAYWEAGYAEGLGKPVIYICEMMKFEEASTHFDTNHCTTVRWSQADPDGFSRELIATLRRSLDLS